MFKKTLIAATIAALSTSAMAIDVSGSSVYTYGAESLAAGHSDNDYADIELNTVLLNLGAAYSVDDIIRVSLSGATFDVDGTYALTTTNNNIVDTGFLSASETELVFRVTVAAAGTAAINLGIAAGSVISLDSIASGSKVTLAASAETSTGIAIDVTGATDSMEVGEVITQHAFSITTTVDEDIDVADERKSLTAATDTAVITYAYTAPTLAATDFVVTGAGEVAVTVNGSFTGYQATQNDSDNAGTITVDAAATTVAADLQSGAADLTRPAVGDTLVVLYTPDTDLTDREVLNTGGYTVDILLDDGTDSMSYTGLSLGSFGLNGSSAQYAYVPVNYDGAVTTQFEIGNEGVVDGEITLTAFDTDGNDYSAELDFKAEAGKVTKISDFAISDAFDLTEGTKLNLTITVNSPNADITYGAYSNRGTTGRMAINEVN